MKAKDTLDYYIRANWLKISRIYNQRAAEYGVTMSVGFILLNIDKEGTPSTSLGPKLGMEATSLSRTLKGMFDRGLIRKEEDAHDKRKVLYFLTQEGIEKRKIAKGVVVELNDHLQSAFTQKQIQNYFLVMERINEMVDSELKMVNS